tara:strand:+ start:342 stop:575 length:234 start_codon:yes stop_codon:yes gene_type:complete
MICTEFNEGNPLEYRWTRSDGYWKMTKGFPSGPRREVQASDLMELLRYEKEIDAMKDKKKKEPSRKSKKPYTKYLGD